MARGILYVISNVKKWKKKETTVEKGEAAGGLVLPTRHSGQRLQFGSSEVQMF